MAWISITEADILTVLSGPELAGYRAAALKAMQLDPVAPVVQQVTDLVRGYVGGNKINQLGAGATIPQKLLAPSLDIIAVRIPLRVGTNPKPGRKEAAEAAVKLLEAVARGAFDIEEPVDVAEETSSFPSPSISARCRQFDREDQDGI